MADNYCQGTMSPDIPLTEEQAEALAELEQLGYGSEPDNEIAARWADEH
jgi:hypothetical protein